ncbi:MAG: hypothetical protein IKY02_03450 [Lachnospiraceae bacterium]|nr:hypothetical protein [Lachnospiraceae bacterium]
MARTKKRRHPFVVFYVLFVLAVALAAAWFYLPIDSFLARHDAERKGYTVVSEPDEPDYRYYYNHLSPTEQEAYTLIVSQLPDFPERITVPNLTSDEVQEVYTAVSYDNPEFFFLGNSCQYMRFGAMFYFQPSYKLTKDAYTAQMAAVEEAANQFLAELPADASDFQKELYVHDRMAEWSDYATGSDAVYTPYGLLVERKANCEGYSRTAQYLLKRLGVVCRVISGTGESDAGTENHMWNIVTVSGREYNMDATWDDYVINRASGVTSDEPSHVFFNATSEEMKADHTPDSEYNWANCIWSDLDYYEWNGLLCDSYEAASTAITRNLPSVLNEGKTTLELKFTSDAAYQKAKIQLIDQDRIYYLISGANVLVKPGNKVSSSKLQYNVDAAHRTLRFFFIK